MAARCETCHFWVPSRTYVEGGTEAQQTGRCKFDQNGVTAQSWHWCGRWRAPTPIAGVANNPEHLEDTQRRYNLEAFLGQREAAE